MALQLLYYTFVCFLMHCLAEDTGRKPPKIVTKGGNLVLQAGDGGNIVFEPGQGKQVFIGGSALNASGSAGVKGEKGDQGSQGSTGKAGDAGTNGLPGKNGTNGVKGAKGDSGPPGQTVSVNGTANVTGPPGQKGESGAQGTIGNPGFNGSKGDKGDPGIQGPSGKNGSQGLQGPPGLNGSKGDPGPQGEQGPPGLSFNTLNQTALSCMNASDYGSVKFMAGFLQVCTKDGWKKLLYQEQLCQKEDQNTPKINHETFKASTFGLLLQFNGDLQVNFSPQINLTNVNVTTVYQSQGGRNVTQYEPSAMGQAVYLKGLEYIDLHGLLADFWSGDEWSVMALIKISADGLNSNKEIPIIGDGETANNKGFHLGIKNQMVLYGFYANDMDSGAYKLDYDRWYHVTWTWSKATKSRKIFIDSKKVKEDTAATFYQGTSSKTQIGTWWDSYNALTTNVRIDTLYIVNKAINYNVAVEEMQLCYARAFNFEMP